MDRDSVQAYLSQRSVLGVHGYALHLIKGTISTVDDFAEYRVFAVEVSLFRVSDEELRFVRVWPRVGHRHHSTGIESECRPDLVIEGFTVDALAAFASTRRVTCLDHEPFDVSVKNTAIVVIGSAELEKVLLG
jgi:hypothetical protein